MKNALQGEEPFFVYHKKVPLYKTSITMRLFHGNVISSN